MATRTSRPGKFSDLKTRWVGAETKPFFLTSEFWVAVLVSGGIAITAASSHAFGAWRAWILIATITSAYLISRGIAKAGTWAPSYDPRDEMMVDKSERHR